MFSSSSLTTADRSALATAEILGFCVLALDLIAVIGVGSITYVDFDLMMLEWSAGTVAVGMLAVWTVVTVFSAIGSLFGQDAARPERRPPPARKLAPRLERIEPTWR
jgi:hypothetical protein